MFDDALNSKLVSHWIFRNTKPAVIESVNIFQSESYHSNVCFFIHMAALDEIKDCSNDDRVIWGKITGKMFNSQTSSVGWVIKCDHQIIY